MDPEIQTFVYRRPSTLVGRDLRLQTSGDRSAVHPRFYAGFLTATQAAAVGLLAVAEVAGSRQYQPRGLVGSDPVVTAGNDRLRFEAFSGCCGVYARLDVLPPGLDGQILGHGTTNVDVNRPLRQALARVAGLAPLYLA